MGKKRRFKGKRAQRLTLALAGLLALLPASVNAQQAAPGNALLPSSADMRLRVDVEMVLLPVSVTDDHQRAVSGLLPQHFEVEEDGQRQEIVSVTEEDEPLSVGFVFDGSGSMADKINLCKLAVLAFFQHAHPEDEYFLIEFNDDPRVLVEFTRNTDRILGHVGAARGGGRTAFYDAVYLALDRMRKARHQRKILLVLSDGADNASRYSEKEVRNAVRESEVQIYTIGVFAPLPYRHAMEEQHGPMYMNRLAEVSGGRGFVVTNPGHLPSMAAAISRELRSQYAVGYYPSNRARNGRWRKVRVKVKPPPGLPVLEAHARSGYYAPSF